METQTHTAAADELSAALRRAVGDRIAAVEVIVGRLREMTLPSDLDREVAGELTALAQALNFKLARASEAISRLATSLSAFERRIAERAR